MATIHETIKNNSSSIAAIFSTIAVIGGAILYVENNFANAKDLKEISENQQKQLKIQSSQQRQMTLFQLDYYEDKLKKLQDEKRVAIERDKTRSQTTRSQTRGIYRTPEEIQEDIDDIKKRREYSRKIIEE